MTSPSVAIVDDHRAVAETFATAINLRAIATATVVAPDDVLAAAVDLVLLDLRLLGRSGVDLVGPLAERGRPVAILTASPGAPDAAAALAAGAAAVLDKAASFEEILGAISGLLGVVRGSVLDELTPSERAVLDDLVEGRTVARIAADRGVSPTTVRTQVRAVLTKLGVHSQLEAVAVARRAGWSAD